MANWQILLVEEVADWFVDLTKNDPGTADLVEDAVTGSSTKGRRSAGLSSIGSKVPATTT